MTPGRRCRQTALQHRWLGRYARVLKPAVKVSNEDDRQVTREGAEALSYQRCAHHLARAVVVDVRRRKQETFSPSR